MKYYYIVIANRTGSRYRFVTKHGYYCGDGIMLLLTLLRHTTWWAPSCSIADPVDHYNSARARTLPPLSETVIAVGRCRRHRLRNRPGNEKRCDIHKKK